MYVVRFYLVDTMCLLCYKYLAEYLGEHLVIACNTRTIKVEHYLDLTAHRGRKAVEEWDKESTEAKLVNGEWQSVYRLRLDPCEFHLPLVFREYYC